MIVAPLDRSLNQGIALIEKGRCLVKDSTRRSPSSLPRSTRACALQVSGRVSRLVHKPGATEMNSVGRWLRNGPNQSITARTVSAWAVTSR